MELSGFMETQKTPFCEGRRKGETATIKGDGADALQKKEARTALLILGWPSPAPQAALTRQQSQPRAMGSY